MEIAMGFVSLTKNDQNKNTFLKFVYLHVMVPLTDIREPFFFY